MLGPISFNILNKNMSDVTENMLSKSENDAQLKMRVGMSNSRSSVQGDLERFQSCVNRNFMKVNKEKHCCKTNSALLERIWDCTECQVKKKIVIYTHCKYSKLCSGLSYKVQCSAMTMAKRSAAYSTHFCRQRKN